MVLHFVVTDAVENLEVIQTAKLPSLFHLAFNDHAVNLKLATSKQLYAVISLSFGRWQDGATLCFIL